MILTYENYRFFNNTLAYYAKNQSLVEKITSTMDANPQQNRMATNNSIITGQNDENEVPYVYSDEIFIDPFFQNEGYN